MGQECLFCILFYGVFYIIYFANINVWDCVSSHSSSTVSAASNRNAVFIHASCTRIVASVKWAPSPLWSDCDAKEQEAIPGTSVLTHWTFHTAVYLSREFMVKNLAESLKFYTDYTEIEVSSLTPLWTAEQSVVGIPGGRRFR